MHKENKTELWMQRPLPEKLLEYAAHDIFMLGKLHEAFVVKGWLDFDIPTLFDQSARYVESVEARGRVAGNDLFRSGACLPLDILTAPGKDLLTCLGCQRSLSINCFQRKKRKRSVMQSPRCRLCNALISTFDESDWKRVG